MADYQQGWQGPQPPMYPQGPVRPGSRVRPARPPAMRRAVSLMYLGAVLGLAGGIVDGLTTKIVTFYSYTSTSNTTTVHGTTSLSAGILVGIIVAALWLWMAWKTGSGRGWARVMSSVFFGFACLQLIGRISPLTRSGGTVPSFIVLLVEWGVGLAALSLLWRRESSEFFASARQAKQAAAYDAVHPGQQPQYSQLYWGEPWPGPKEPPDGT
jgi:hypothetical protein